ncbi:hypothetical protein BN2476_240011 [Paraburkholderia piptadeniae]|uniref:Uncharacterized protein n=1 Tax=Paraburkholderia piptadeniae TaxID=1701573 RepID=A0A1N7RYD7_9BURK|nr:hypothetical protein BN2476_240011 [Paraburkholderia piptadeniae]
MKSTDESFQANSFRNLAIAGTFMVLIARVEKVFLHGVNHPDFEKDCCSARVVIRQARR